MLLLAFYLAGLLAACLVGGCLPAEGGETGGLGSVAVVLAWPALLPVVLWAAARVVACRAMGR